MIKKRGFGSAFLLRDVGRADKIMGSNLVKDTKYRCEGVRGKFCKIRRKYAKIFIKNIKKILDNRRPFDYYMRVRARRVLHTRRRLQCDEPGDCGESR